MTCNLARVSTVALIASLAPLSAARADMSAAPTPTAPAAAPSTAAAPNAATPSLAEPAPTPDFWAESGPGGPTVAQRPAVRHYTRHSARHYAWRNGRRYYSDNPVGAAAIGVVGGVADLGSIAAYPFYCFPDYGSCSVRVPYRF
jgi:hypothetical protein